MNTPNKITVLRIFLVPLFVISLIIYKTDNLIPCSIFIIASLTDMLDGYIARKYHLVTTFGKFLDPIADKLLVMAAFIMLVELSKIPAWIVIVIVSRKLLITGFRTIAASSGVTIAASSYGKLKTITQMLCIILMLSNNAFFTKFLFSLSNIMLYLALLFTLISGIDYILKNKNVLDLEHI